MKLVTSPNKRHQIKFDLDIGIVVFLFCILSIASLSLMSTSPEMSQTLLISGLTLLAAGAAIWGK